MRAYLDSMLVAESPVDVHEEERPSGLLVKHEIKTSLRRGVILDVGEEVPVLKKGMVIYFTHDHGTIPDTARLEGEVKIVGVCGVLAYEDGDD